MQNRPTLIEQGAALHISSRITGEDLDVLRIALEEGRVVALDFAEVKLVDHDAVRLLARTDVNGIELRHNPVYIMGDGRPKPQLARQYLAGTAFFEKQSRTG